MEEIIRLKDQFYVLATSSLADQRTRVLKHEQAFAVFDVHGNIHPVGTGYQGIFDGTTRFLSLLDMQLGRVRPLLLSSTIKNDNSLLTVDMMNRDTGDGLESLMPGTLHVFRSKILLNRICHERIRITNFASYPVELTVLFRYESDFRDIFEIRGITRASRGEMRPAELTLNTVCLVYHGLDGITRRTRLEFSPTPTKLSPGEAHFVSTLGSKQSATFYLTISCETGQQKDLPLTYNQAVVTLSKTLKAEKAKDCHIRTSNHQFNQWLYRSQADLHMMVTRTPHGPYPFAGVPLFNTVFGRDGLITAYQALWVNPDIARGVLAYLAATQATARDDSVDAEPGKILHEVRGGEMVELGEVPFKRYYGSVDSTPLFLILAGKYFTRTGDLNFIHGLWENLELALQWIDKFGDLDNDGFVEYQRRSPNGLLHQGWKDSSDSVFHEDGTAAAGPIALCEIQAYVYEAKRQMAHLLKARGETKRAANLLEQAEQLREHFDAAFWIPEKNCYALALDGEKKNCRVLSSNAGHCLFSGIAYPHRARLLGSALLSDSMFSGWGIRTLSSAEVRYNPMSYHNGSIWPHDNSLIAEGLSRFGMKTGAMKVLTALFNAATTMDLYRLPELYCGFVRRPGEGPTLYPVACAPQAWASASVFLLLKALLGIRLDSKSHCLKFSHPQLPDWLDELRVHNLKIGTGTVDFVVERHDYDVGVRILKRTGPVEVAVFK